MIRADLLSVERAAQRLYIRFCCWAGHTILVQWQKRTQAYTAGHGAEILL